MVRHDDLAPNTKTRARRYNAAPEIVKCIEQAKTHNAAVAVEGHLRVNRLDLVPQIGVRLGLHRRVGFRFVVVA